MSDEALKKDYEKLTGSDIKAFIGQLVERFTIEFKKMDRSGIYGYTQRAFAYNSNKIEGSTLTEDQTASLFETGTLLAGGEIIRAKDIEEMTGHFSMFNTVMKTWDAPLTEELIKLYHKHLKSGVFEDMANGYPVGEYKNRKNIVGRITTAPPEEVHSRMKALIEAYEGIPEVKLINLCRFHAIFETIHPFQDGNGRTGRAVLFKECLKNNIIPFIIRDVNKAEYIAALYKAQTEGVYEGLESLFKREQEDYYNKAVEFLRLKTEDKDVDVRYEL